MDQIKVGKLIRELRLKKGLTQTELCEMFGIGYRAVSKWERGINCPDIAIINELSKILGITTDELLNGELTDETKLKLNIPLGKSKNKLYVIIPSIFLLLVITIIGLFIFNNRNEGVVYDIYSVNPSECYMEGKVTIKGDSLSIFINKLVFNDSELNKTLIKNYGYKIYYGDLVITKYYNVKDSKSVDIFKSVKEITKSFSVNYIAKTQYDFYHDNQLLFDLVLTFATVNDEELKINVPFELVKSQEK